MKVAVIMGNDYPMDVVPVERAEARMAELRKQKQAEWEREAGADFKSGPRFRGSGDYWIRSFEFEVKS